jgi:hypothetical protein
VAPGILAVDLDLALEHHGVPTCGNRSRNFMSSTQAVLYCTPISRESWSAALPLTLFTENQMAISIFLKVSFREANTVPEVTVKTLLQALSEHLKRPRLIEWQRSVPHCGQYGSPSVSGQRIFLNQM